MSYLSIKLYPCKNSTDNNNSDIVCKSQDIIDSYLMLIKIYLDSVNNINTRHCYYRQLYFFVIENFKNNLNVVTNIFNFMNETISEIPELEDFELFDRLFLNENIEIDKGKDKKDNQQLVLNLNLIIFNILIKMSFIDTSK